ncbi:hypothetical protein Q7P37_001934 [Cladosporium fusiforme]
MATLISTIGAREQPFECQICRSRFTRHENLKRHSTLHTRPKGDSSFECRLCSTTFSRRDLRDRHFKRKHPDQQEQDRPVKARRRDTVTSVGASGNENTQGPQGTSRLSRSPSGEQSDSLPHDWDDDTYRGADSGLWSIHEPFQLPQSDCQGIAMSTSAPCHTSLEQYSHELGENYGLPTEQPALNSYEQGPAERQLDILLQGASGNQDFSTLGPANFTSPTPSLGSSPESTMRRQDGPALSDSPYLRDGWYPSTSQIDRGLDLYFTHVSHFVPFLHQATFDAVSAPPCLIFGILSLAYQHGEDPDIACQGNSGKQLAATCFHHGRALCTLEAESDDDSTHNLALVQSLLLLEICAMVYICGKTSKQGLKMHGKVVSIARSAGLMQAAAPSTTRTKDLESMWQGYIQAESLKRTILAMHQVDALWYQFLSVPRSLSHLEIKHDLPCPVDCWTATSAAEWAHQRLGASPCSLPVQYPDAVRRFLSRSPEVDSIPPFDPYGAINVAQFLLSSAREVSGWSTITGHISAERFEPLRASLVALASSLCPQGETAVPSHAATRAATWEMAMIEFFIWSPSHTSGIVESSLDGMLTRSTHLAHTSELNFKEDVVAAIQPHLDWFLRYLDATIVVSGEAPWVPLYAYRAFLLTWQLLKEGVPGAMVVVCVQDGDLDGALAWATEVFSRRTQSQTSKLIIECLETLSQ